MITHILVCESKNITQTGSLYEKKDDRVISTKVTDKLAVLLKLVVYVLVLFGVVIFKAAHTKWWSLIVNKRSTQRKQVMLLIAPRRESPIR